MVARKKIMKIFGITRKTLDHYSDIGLLCPNNKDEIEVAKITGFKPEWQYDDYDVEKLKLIQIFRALNYEPAEIKDLFDNKLDGIFDIALDKLLTKRKEIDGMISFVKMLQAVEKLPDSAIGAVKGADIECFLAGNSYSEKMSEVINALADCPWYEDEDGEWIMNTFQLLFSIIGFKDKGPKSQEVKSVLWEVYKYALDKLLEKEKENELRNHIDELLYDPEIVEFMFGAADDIIELWEKDITEKYGKDGYLFMHEAIESFKNELMNNSDENKMNFTIRGK